MALSGLRRLAVHARGGLAATAIEPKWTYNTDAWSPAAIRRYAAVALAREVLTLMIDCIADDGGLSADEAALVTESGEKAIAAANARYEAERDLRIKAEVERDQAVESLCDLEAEEESASDVLVAVRELARTDVPAAVRALLEERS